MRWYFLASLLLLTGCATSRLYYGEPMDKSNASFIRSVYVKALIRPSKADESTRLRITEDGIWVSGGSFLVKYTCLDSRDDEKVEGYANEQTIHIEAGYHFDVECSDDKTKLKLVNSAWEDFDYKTFYEAIVAVPEHVRKLDEMPTGDGFRFLHYNDWGGSDETNFEIYTNYFTKRLEATYTQYHGSVMYLAGDAFERGIRKEKEMMQALMPEEYTVDVADCPLLADHYAQIRKAFDTRYTNGPLPSESTEGKMFLDSPAVYRYFLGKGHGATVALTLTVEQGALYAVTEDAMRYVKSCAASLGNKK